MLLNVKCIAFNLLSRDVRVIATEHINVTLTAVKNIYNGNGSYYYFLMNFKSSISFIVHENTKEHARENLFVSLPVFLQVELWRPFWLVEILRSYSTGTRQRAEDRDVTFVCVPQNSRGCWWSWRIEPLPPGLQHPRNRRRSRRWGDWIQFPPHSHSPSASTCLDSGPALQGLWWAVVTYSYWPEPGGGGRKQNSRWD